MCVRWRMPSAPPTMTGIDSGRSSPTSPRDRRSLAPAPRYARVEDHIRNDKDAGLRILLFAAKACNSRQSQQRDPDPSALISLSTAKVSTTAVAPTSNGSTAGNKRPITNTSWSGYRFAAVARFKRLSIRRGRDCSAFELLGGKASRAWSVVVCGCRKPRGGFNRWTQRFALEGS
jgi:hypothetical protein